MKSKDEADDAATSVVAAEQTLPLFEEQLEIRRERVETGAVRARVETQTVKQPVELRQWTEAVEVQRVPIDRVVQELRSPWQDGAVWVVPVYEERVVQQRVLVLKEELRLHRRVAQQVQRTEVPLRREHAVIERRSEQGDWIAEQALVEHGAADDVSERGDSAAPPHFPSTCKES